MVTVPLPPSPSPWTFPTPSFSLTPDALFQTATGYILPELETFVFALAGMSIFGFIMHRMFRG